MPTERPTKRSRVSRACDQCRTAREKCDGTQPVCLTCSASRRSCTYTSAPKKRGIQPGYIRSLELALTWLFQNTDCEATLNRKLAQEGASSVLFDRDSRESNKLHKSWRRSRFFRDVDKLLSGEQIGQGNGDDQTPKSDDDDSDAEAEVNNLQNQLSTVLPREAISPTPHVIASRILAPAGHSLSSISAQATGQRCEQSGVVTSLPSSSWRLLDIYFAYTQSWLPICEKHDILRISYSYPNDGLNLSVTDLPKSGDHAELWSILTVAAHQARLNPHESEALPDIERSYSITRGLIPNETGLFTTGHVKALLNLAIVNLGRAAPYAAWLLVGSASRILTIVEQRSEIIIPRWKHLRAGCFILDTLVSNQLRKRPHLQRCDVESVEEDGLEEWQPWTSPIHTPLAPPSRTPVLGLSSFNQLLDVTDILYWSNAERQGNYELSSPQLLSRLDTWKSSLPAHFDHIKKEDKQMPCNPPALLLHLTYMCTSFSILPSQALCYRILDVLEFSRNELGIHALPPAVLCLLKGIQRSSAYCTMEQQLQSRLRKIETDIICVWTTNRQQDAALAPVSAPLPARPTYGAYQIPTPESIQIPPNTSFTPLNQPSSSAQRATTSLLHDLLPDMNPALTTGPVPASLQDFSMSTLEDDFRRPSLHHRNSGASRDLETFFDDLASLDGAEKVDNQPQFMQNLGFAPDANMADLLAAEFGQFLPTHSSTFMPQSEDPTQLDPVFFGAT